MSGRLDELLQLVDVGLDREMRIGSSGSAPTSLSVVGLTVPEDHTAPHAVLQSFLERHLETGNPYGAVGAQRLSFGQIGRPLAEEEFVVVAV